jgi:hypothetical protein
MVVDTTVAEGTMVEVDTTVAEDTIIDSTDGNHLMSSITD